MSVAAGRGWLAASRSWACNRSCAGGEWLAASRGSLRFSRCASKDRHRGHFLNELVAGLVLPQCHESQQNIHHKQSQGEEANALDKQTMQKRHENGSRQDVHAPDECLCL